MSILTQNNQQSMTSQQIAELVGSRHDKVKQSIERLATNRELKPAVIALPPMGVVQMMTNNRSYDTEVYVFSGEQGKRDSIIVVAQLSPEFTAALVDRWTELEKQVAAPVVALPQDYLSALKALVMSEEAKERANAEIQLLQPKAAALDAISHSKGSTGIRETAKAVGMGQNEFVAWCTNPNKPASARFMYRDHSGALNAYSHRIDQGFVTQKLSCFIGGDGRDRTAPKVRFTASGVTQIAKMLQQEHARELEAV